MQDILIPAGLVLALAAALFVGGCMHGKSQEQIKTAEAIAAAQVAARASEAAWDRQTAQLRGEKDAEINRIAGLLGSMSRELRNRPTRLPETARAACSGSTGKELSGEDAEFLAGFAAEAAQQAAELDECTGWIDTVRGGRSAEAIGD